MGSLGTSYSAPEKTTMKLGGSGMHSPGQDRSGQRRIVSHWSSSFTNCMACSGQCCGPECNMRKKGASSS